MLTETQLKEKLQTLAKNEFRLSENDDLSELIPAMLGHVGSTDPDLRDGLIYSAFGTWTLRHSALSQQQLHELLPKVLSEQHMLYKLGEQGTDSVFRRSFSVLLLPLLLIANRSHPFIAASEVRQIKDKLLHYLRNEKDRRGFVEGKGWAHAVAHAADALDDLAQCPEMNQSDLTEILEVIRDVMCARETGHIHLEEERMITAVIAVLKRESLSGGEITRWVEGFSDPVLAVTSGPERLVIRANVKNLLQSLFFRLHWELKTNAYDAPIDRTLHKIDLFTQHADG